MTHTSCSWWKKQDLSLASFRNILRLLQFFSSAKNKKIEITEVPHNKLANPRPYMAQPSENAVIKKSKKSFNRKTFLVSAISF